MGFLTIPLITAIIAQLVSTGAKVAAGRKQEKFQKEQEKVVERERKKSEREARRAALARAIGSTAVFAPRPGERAPEAPSLTTERIVGGLGDIAGQVSAQALAGTPGAPGVPTAPGSQGALRRGVRDFRIRG